MIFVCYSSKDARQTRVVVDDLRRAHYEVWFDDELLGSQLWWDKILERIRTCSVFLFITSEESLNSKACEAEWTYARSLGRPILPVQIASIPNLLAHPIGEFQSVDYIKRSINSVIELTAAVRSCLEAPAPLPDPLPYPPEVPYAFLAGIARKLAKPELTDAEQSDILDQLQRGLEDEDRRIRPDIFELLRRLRRRRDIGLLHASRIDGLLRKYDSRRWRVLVGITAVAVIAISTSVVLLRSAPCEGATCPPPPPTTSASAAAAASSAASSSSSSETPTPVPIDPHSADPIPDTSLVVALGINGSTDLYLVDSQTQEIGQKLTAGAAPFSKDFNPLTPAISPDRRSIVYLASESDTQGTLRVMAADGTGDRELFSAPTDCDRYLAPAWAPSQDRLGVACLTADSRFRMRIVDLDGNTIHEFHINNAWVDDLSFSPDGRFLAYFSGKRGDPAGSIYTVATDETSDPVNLTNAVTDSEPAWSPDGNNIAFVRGHPKPDDKNGDIFVMAKDGSNQRAIVENDADDRNPAWSRDSRSIVFRSNRDQSPEDTSGYFVADVEVGNVERLLPAVDGHAAGPPSWGNR